ncbi:hypothetical protein [Azospirillum canadense]|uniref:hypothetical protein n=1 Tax=Azospirillum canadense TaxID=403962 RepID=UPI0022270254|nr:hypothetical protein [Azospirillum canadense]MCW2241607.1 hypothetical protein [Azospirillum canadense]
MMSKMEKSSEAVADVKPVDIADLEAVVGGVGVTQSQIVGGSVQTKAYTTMCWSTMCWRPGTNVNPVINPVLKK